MGFWKSFFGGEEENPEEEKKNNDERNFDLLKYDGVKAMRIHQMDYAVKCFREALKIKDDLETRDYLSQALLATGALEESLAELKTIAAKAPDNVKVLLQAAHVAYMVEDYAEMKALCQQAQELAGDNATIIYMLAQAAKGEGNMVETIALLTKAIALDEQHGDARLLRARTLLAMGDAKSAREDADWLTAHTEDNEDVLLLAARVAYAEGKAAEAIDIYDKVMEQNPFQLDALRERGKLKLEQGDKQGAEEDMRRLLELNPGELDGTNGEYEAEGVEQMMKRAYSPINPFGL